MARETNTPLILWICAAVCVHYLFADAGGEVAKIHEDHSFMSMLGDRVRARVRSDEQTFDIAVNEPAKPADEIEPPPPEPPKPPELKKDEKKKEEAKKTPEELKKEEKKKAEEKKVALVVKKDEVKPIEPPAAKDNRIAVRQHVQPKQEDNPTARFIADEANHVDKETAATQTSHDQDDPNPTPAGNHPGDRTHVGDANETKIADSDEHKGDKRNAPGEKGTEFEVQREPPPTKPMGPIAMQGPVAAVQPQAGGDGKPPQSSVTDTPIVPGGAAQPTTEAPEATPSPNGDWALNPVIPGYGAAPAVTPGPGDNSRTPRLNQNNAPVTKWLGLGGAAGPGQPNLNLTQQGVIAIVGQDQLRKEREADGERRLSQHRGAWTASNFERWRSAIENYVSSVKPGNQTALNTAQKPFASYLNGMHNRIHPLFADNFLGSLESLPPTHPLNDKKLVTSLEIIVTRDGHLVKMGVVKTSGITAFDIAALDAVNRAQPFGTAPSAIISPDGNVYLHWEFHRDEVFACSTMNARPFILKAGPKPADPQTPAAPTSPASPSQEHGAPPPTNLNEVREGLNDDAMPVSLPTTHAS
jgi:TonB family protein